MQLELAPAPALRQPEPRAIATDTSTSPASSGSSRSERRSTSAARRRKISEHPTGPRRVTTGTPGLMIPAFSRRDRLDRLAQVLARGPAPRWSGPTTSGRMTFVASSRPPSPTSTTAISTPASAKARNAIAVVASKNDALLTLGCRPQPARRSDKCSSPIRDAIDLDPLAEGAEMRRGVEARHAAPLRSGAEATRRGDRTLPVRATDVDVAERDGAGRPRPRAAAPSCPSPSGSRRSGAGTSSRTILHT